MAHESWLETLGASPSARSAGSLIDRPLSSVRPLYSSDVEHSSPRWERLCERNHRAAFGAALDKSSIAWDLAIDCICFSAEDARQTLNHLSADRVGHLVFVSTDSVVESHQRPWKIDETYDRFASTPYGRGKRDAEEVLLERAPDVGKRPRISILRPDREIYFAPGACCHRVYSTEKARAHGILLPSTTLEEGIRIHVESFRER